MALGLGLDLGAVGVGAGSASASAAAAAAAAAAGSLASGWGAGLALALGLGLGLLFGALGTAGLVSRFGSGAGSHSLKGFVLGEVGEVGLGVVGFDRGDAGITSALRPSGAPLCLCWWFGCSGVRLVVRLVVWFKLYG